MSMVSLRTLPADNTRSSRARSPKSARHDGVFGGYNSLGSYSKAFDEMFDAQGNVRGPYKGIFAELSPSDASELAARSEALGRAFIDQGITFSLSGQERPFPLDLVPRVISAAEWTRLEKGITQRVKALEAYLDDIYGEQEILRDGVIPRRLVTSCEHFHREAVGISPPNGVRIHVAGIDLVRDAQGSFRVLEDNLRSPSGVSYVMENRRTMARVFPNLFATHRVRAVGDYSSHLLRALRNAAASNEADPTVVVLTPGVYNSAYFEHSLLARQMGVELVEGRDLFCRDNTVYMRTTEGERQVDVIYRRIDDDFLDPMQFNPNSVLGVAGLLNAARAGNVVISSAVGNGVGDDKLVYTYVPTIIEYYLGEKPLLANVDTFRCWLDEEREEVLDRVDELVIKPVEGSGGYGIVFGPDASEKELAAISKKVRSDPRGWIAQPVVQLSTVPTQIDDCLAPRHVDLRPFAVNDGDDVWVLPGGLTRVALPEGFAGGQLQPGRRIQGHLGAGLAHVGGRPRTRRGRSGAVTAQGAQGREERRRIRKLTAAATAAVASAERVERINNSSSSSNSRRCTGAMMLARNAESLYWIGRYVERADDTARILDVTVHQLLEDSSVDPDQTSRTLLRVLGIEPPDESLDVWSLTDIVAFSRDTQGACSIVEAISAARENARGAREVTSTEIWECLNTTYNALAERERAAKRLGPHEFLSFVEGRAAMFAGLADSTLSRDDGYRFMVLGRAIERVDMTVRLLLARVGDSASSPAWVTVLRSAGAHDTYLRTYRGVLDAAGWSNSCCWTGFSRGLSCTRCDSPSTASTNCATGHSIVSAPPQRHSDCWDAPAASWSSCALASCSNRSSNASPVCRRRALTSEKRWRWSTSTPHRGSRGRMRDMPPWSSRKAKSDVAPKSGAFHRLRLQVAGDRILQRGQADTTIGFPPKRHPESCRNRPGDKVIPLRRLLGHRGDGVRPPRTAHRVGGDVVVGCGNRPRRYAQGGRHLGGPAFIGGDRPVR